MKIVLATLAQPTYTSELYDWSLRDLADLFETKAFATQEEALSWATAEILQRNEEIAKENVECAAFREEDEEPTHLFEVCNDTMEPDGTRVVLWTEEGDPDAGTPDASYVLIMREVEVG